jgi:hypothetical protein
MNLPFNIKFVIFDENNDLTRDQKGIRIKLVDNDIEKILKYAISTLNEYKFLDRVEPATMKKNNCD